MSSQRSATVRRSAETLRLNDDEQRSIRYGLVLSRLAGYLLRYRGPVAVSLVTLIVYSAATVAMPWVVKVAIDNYIANESRDLAGLAGMVGLFGVLALIQFGTGYVHRIILVCVGQNMIPS